MLVYEERGKPEYPQKNLSEQGRTQPNYNVDAGIWTWAILVGDECSHHCTTLLLNMYEYEENKKKRLLKNVNNNNVHTYV